MTKVMMTEYKDFWASNPRIHGMYQRPLRMMPNSPIQYVGYALFCMLMMASNSGLTNGPIPKYIEKINEPHKGVTT